MAIKAQDIATLVEMFEASNWDELHVEIEDLHLFLSTDPNARLTSGTAAAAPVLTSALMAAAAPAAPSPQPDSGPAAAPTPTGGGEEVQPGWVPVKAPNLGTFYRAPKPGAAPFVEVGQLVEASTEICLLEVMKLFTAVTAGTAGVVRKVCVQDGEMVEFDQVLFCIEPA